MKTNKKTHTPPKLPRQPRNKKTIGKKTTTAMKSFCVTGNFSIITLSPPWDVNDVNMINQQRCQNLKSWRQALERGVCWYLWISLIYIDMIYYNMNMMCIYIHIFNIIIYIYILYSGILLASLILHLELNRPLFWIGKGLHLEGSTPKYMALLVQFLFMLQVPTICAKVQCWYGPRSAPQIILGAIWGFTGTNLE